MKNIGVKISIWVLALLCAGLFAIVVVEFFVIKDKDEEIKNNVAIISAKDECIGELENNKKSLQEEMDEINSKLKYYKTPEKERKLEDMWHPIEKEQLGCVTNLHGSTLTYSQQIAACFDKVNDKWEKKMQRRLLELSENLEKEEYTLFLASQKDWEKYRKSQIRMIKKIYSNTMATIYQEYKSWDIMYIAEYRARYFSFLLALLKDRK